jgi:Protein of unknown function (DUF2510)
MSDVPEGWYPHPYQAGLDLYWDGSGWTTQTRPSDITTATATPSGSPEPSGPPAAPSSGRPQPASHPARPRAAWLALTLIPILVVLAIGGVLILVVRNPSPQAEVANALAATLSKGSADVTLSGKIHVAGVSAPISGKGAFSFTRNVGVEDLKVTLAGQTIVEKVINFNDDFYLNIGNDISKVLPGKSWIQLNLSNSDKATALGAGGATGAGSNPGAELNILGIGGERVTALGPSTINGAPVQGYLVVVGSAEIAKEVANPHLPKWVRQAAAQVRNEKVGYKVFVGDSGTVRRLTTGLSESVDGQSYYEFSSQDFSHLGTAVHASPPPADQVGSYAAFVKAAKALGSNEVN